MSKLKPLAREVRGNAVWDGIKLSLSYLAIVLTSTGALAALIRYLSAIPLDVWLIAGIFLLSFLSISTAFLIARRQNRLRLQPQTTVTLETQQATKQLNDTQHEIESYITQIKRLQNEATTQEIRLSARQSELESLEAELNGYKVQYEWLHTIAEEDKRDISKAVFVFLKIVENRLSDSVPIIYFTFSVFNGSVYSLGLDPSWEGEIRFRKRGLMGPIKINGFRNLARGYTGDFTVTFQPTPAEATFILEAQSKAEGRFWFDQLTIKVNGGDQYSEIQAKRLKLPTEVYATEPTERIVVLKTQHESEKRDWQKRANLIATLSEVLGMAEGLIRIYSLPNRIPPEQIEEWKLRLETALRHCYGERWATEFYPFPHDGKTIEGPKDGYSQEQWFGDYMNRLKEVIDGLHQA